MKSFQVTDFNAPLQEVDQPTPQPSGTQVLIKVKAAGVCHSDLHIWEGGYDLGHGRKPLSLRDRGVSLPRTMGHETVGEVLAFGPDARAETGGLKVGDVALVYPWLGCGKATQRHPDGKPPHRCRRRSAPAFSAVPPPSICRQRPRWRLRTGRSL